MYYFSTNQWVKVGGTLKVGEKGYIEWRLSGDNKDLKQDTLYRLTETTPEMGYKILEENTYFICVGDHGNFEKAYENSGAKKVESIVKKDKIVKISNGGGIHYITNKNIRLTVNKIWQDSKGIKTDGPTDKEVKIKLYRQAKREDGHKVKVILKSQHNGDKESEVLVNKNTGRGVTISFSKSMQSASYSYIDKDNKKIEAYFDNYDEYPTLTIDSITKDTVVTINHKYDNPDITFSKYDKAGFIEIGEREQVGDDIILSKDNKWSNIWDDLDYKDSQENLYYYTVEEENIPGYSTTYTNNEGIQNGDINVINTAEESGGAELPMTGGEGILLFRITGLLMLSIAIFARFIFFRGFRLR